MAVFPQEHQDAIDKINHDGWRYLCGRVDEIAETFGGTGHADGDTIYLRVAGIDVAIEQGDPNLEWTLPAEWKLPPTEKRSFTKGFLLSVKANPESTSNRVICRPIDWYMLCVSLQIGLNMAELGLAAAKVDHA